MSKIKANFLSEIDIDILEDFLHETKDGVLLSIKVKPNSKIEKLSLMGIEQLCLSVSGPALENAANQRVIEIFANIFSLPKSSIEIINGHTSQYKRIFIKKRMIKELLASYLTLNHISN